MLILSIIRRLGFKVYQDIFFKDCIDHVIYMNNQPVVIIDGIKVWLVEHRVTLDDFQYVGYRSKKSVIDEILTLIMKKLI